ncbi:MAG: monofunctional biosynthetic peptidoglycan transglycosylase [Deltaproteobacteria bacterium]|nr:monofunctional biosynthetic peptidoglycan transglycosylase [Deltaproteobacteria bacterium]
MRFRSRARGRGRGDRRNGGQASPTDANPFALLEQELGDPDDTTGEETADPVDAASDPPRDGEGTSSDAFESDDLAPLSHAPRGPDGDRIVAGEPRPRPRSRKTQRTKRATRSAGSGPKDLQRRGGAGPVSKSGLVEPGSVARAESASPRRRLGRLFAYTALFLIVMPAVPVTLFRFVPPPASAMMLKRWVDARIEGRVFDLDYDWTPREEIARSLRRAVVASEDQRFYDHAGFDWKELQNALDEWRDGGSLRGASTISQQVAKNLFLWPGRSFLRKVFEAWFTIWIEWIWPKQRILEVYLNIAELGDGVFGAEAASRRYFKHSAAKLVPHESALLAAALPSPLRSNPANPSAYMRKRQSWILRHL